MADKNTMLFIAAAVVVGFVLLSSNASADSDSGSDGGSGSMVSSSQLQQTANFEGFRSTAYKDGTGSNGQQLYSIGYGHQIQPGESNLMTATINTDQGLQLLDSDMQKVVNVINQSGNSFTQGQFDALADFGYNAGTGALQSVINVYNSSGADAVPGLMLQYVKWHPIPGGAAVVNQDLVSRRNANVATWNS